MHQQVILLHFAQGFEIFLLLREWNLHSRRVFTGKLATNVTRQKNQNFEARQKWKSLNFQDFKNAYGHCRFLRFSLFWRPILSSMQKIFNGKPLYVCKKLVETLRHNFCGSRRVTVAFYNASIFVTSPHEYQDFRPKRPQNCDGHCIFGAPKTKHSVFHWTCCKNRRLLEFCAPLPRQIGLL